MGLGQRLLGGPHGHAPDGSGGHIRHAKLYETFAMVGFGGQRRRVYDGLVALSGAQPGEQAVDIGCGTGYLTGRMARAVAPDGRVIGVDPSKPVIAHATRTAPPHCSFVVAGAERLPMPDNSSDVVVSSLAVHHIPPALRPTAFREMYRILRPGGRFLVADFRPPRNRVARRLIGALSGHAMQHNPIDQLADLVTGAGFAVTHTGDRSPWLRYILARRPEN